MEYRICSSFLSDKVLDCGQRPRANFRIWKAIKELRAQFPVSTQSVEDELARLNDEDEEYRAGVEEDLANLMGLSIDRQGNLK